MDITTIPVGSDTRNAIREYKQENDFQNYDEAMQALLDEVGY